MCAGGVEGQPGSPPEHHFVGVFHGGRGFWHPEPPSGAVLPGASPTADLVDSGWFPPGAPRGGLAHPLAEAFQVLVVGQVERRRVGLVPDAFGPESRREGGVGQEFRTVFGPESVYSAVVVRMAVGGHGGVDVVEARVELCQMVTEGFPGCLVG